MRYAFPGRLAGLCLLLLIAPSADAVANCGALTQAEKAYMTGDFDASKTVIHACLGEEERSEEQTCDAYALLAMVHIAEEVRDEAIAAVEQLLDLVPDYEPASNGSPTFRLLVRDIKARRGDPEVAVSVPQIDEPEPDYAALDPAIPLVYLDVAELNLGQEVLISRLTLPLKRALDFHGFGVVGQPEGADFQLEVRAATRQGVAFHGKHTAFADLRLTLSDLATGRERYETTLLDVKGAQVTFENAGLDALSQAALQLHEDVFPDLLARLRASDE